MSVVLAMLAVTASCVPSDNPKLTKLETAAAFFTALNSQDHATLGALIKPGARLVMGPDDSLDLAELLGMMPADAKLEAKSMTLDDAGNVVVKTRSSDGTDATGLIRIEGGCVTGLEHQH
jgi:hypothetical protein